MKRPDPGLRRRAALELAAAALPIFRRCAGVGWLPAIPAGAAAALVLTLARRVLGAGSLRAAAHRGRTGRLALTVLLLSLLGLAAWAGRESALAFPETAGSFPAAALTAGLAWAAVRRGAQVPGRCAAVLVRLLALLYGVVLVFSLPQLQLRWLRPAGTVRGGLDCFCLLLLPGAGLCLETGSRERFPVRVWAAAALAVLAAAVTAGILSPALAAEPMAFHTLARSVSVLGVMQRFEALVSAAQLISGFCLCALLLAACRSLLEALAGRSRAARLFPSALPLLVLAIPFMKGILPRILGIFAICSGLAATLLLWMDQEKNFLKSQKNA